MNNEFIFLDDHLATHRLLLLHGWGADAEDLLPLGMALKNIDENIFEIISYRAPQLHPDGFGKQWYSLYPHDWDSVPAAVFALESRIKATAMESEIPLSQTYLLGFSQGGAMALEIASNMLLGGVIACSSYPHPSWLPKQNMSKLFLAHGKHDQVVPWTASEKTVNLMIRNNLECELFLFDGKHEIPNSAIQAIQLTLKNWL